ncbi:hypothetical protein [Caldanaerobacter subterraneus]|uniref:Uncharacterized protein n=1 Tax=Caldanaerobacter subterraneus TaxID=911092 RepID=A0A7Y2PLE6_9THEO|nr:hypothetical protein [Caldanaerobacter subterraneus]NNG67176.1 hypothetical protein [Caldanaerobacter subterraneus]
MNRKTGIIFTLLGIFILLAGFPLRSFIYQEEFILKNDLNRRFISFLYDNGLLDSNISDSYIAHYYFSKNVLSIFNAKGHKLRGLTLYPKDFSHLRTIKTIVVDSLFINFYASEQYEQEIRDILVQFDPKSYPINPEAIKLALLKNAYANFGPILAFIKEHGIIGIPRLFIGGFNSAIRIPAVLLIYKSPTMQEFFQSLTLPVIGLIMTAIGLFSLHRHSQTR